MLALSGRGLRAAYFSSAVMLKLQKVFPDRDLLREVDVISSVSGGSITAAYYAISKDADIADAALAEAAAPAVAGKIGRKADGSLSCSASLTSGEETRLRVRLADNMRERDAAYAARKIADLCHQAGVASNRIWDEATVRDLMTRDYVWRWSSNRLWPTNIGQYWFTAFDLSDLMAQTFADNLYDVAITGRDLTFADLNPERPHLIMNSTNATKDAGTRDRFQFDSVFTFTTEDFRDRIYSDISTYSVARAVMASNSIPGVPQGMRLLNFRPHSYEDRYVHAFEGEYSDSLALSTLKRVLVETALDRRVGNDKPVVIISIDAFTPPAGTPSAGAELRGDLPRSTVGSPPQANRSPNLDQFHNRAFTWRECEASATHPTRLCDTVSELGESLRERLRLDKRLVFYHIGFEGVGDALFEEAGKDGKVERIRLDERLHRIPISLRLSEQDRLAIDRAVELIVDERNPCLRAIRDIAAGAGTSAEAAHRVCREMGPGASRK
jgi:predicted acylesterase/phospholipase RssA